MEGVKKKPSSFAIDTMALPSKCSLPQRRYIYKRLHQSCQSDVWQSRTVDMEIYTVCYASSEEVLPLLAFCRKATS